MSTSYHQNTGPIFQTQFILDEVSVTCTLGLTNDLIDGDQPSAKPHLRKAKPNHVLKPFLALGWSPSINSLVNPRVHVRPRIK